MAVGQPRSPNNCAWAENAITERSGRISAEARAGPSGEGPVDGCRSSGGESCRVDHRHGEFAVQVLEGDPYRHADGRPDVVAPQPGGNPHALDRKSTRLNSSH